MDLGSYGAPYGLVDSLCTLQSKVTLSTATLDSGGWLGLATPGLAPRKKCRAWLGAPTSAKAEAAFQVRTEM
jgi:hypothetical protein